MANVTRWDMDIISGVNCIYLLPIAITVVSRIPQMHTQDRLHFAQVDGESGVGCKVGPVPVPLVDRAIVVAQSVVRLHSSGMAGFFHDGRVRTSL